MRRSLTSPRGKSISSALGTAPSTAVTVQVTRAGAQSNVGDDYDREHSFAIHVPQQPLDRRGVGDRDGGGRLPHLAMHGPSRQHIFNSVPTDWVRRTSRSRMRRRWRDEHQRSVGSRRRANCQLTIGGVAATVTYCGAAPGLVIGPVELHLSGGDTIGAPVEAVLTITNPRAEPSLSHRQILAAGRRRRRPRRSKRDTCWRK